jgi:tetraacyldisaccharide 4'-kinase
LLRWLQRQWWQPRPTLAMRCLQPLSWLARVLARSSAPVWIAPCPVIVVGNLIVGGAGKTPTVMALVRALQSAGYHPGVVSRGHGRSTRGPVAWRSGSQANEVGDEPWLIARTTGVPLVVAEARVLAAQKLLQEHPQVDVIVADDGLQHHALGRDAEVWVFDERGAGNGLLLPAGPLRQPMPTTVPARARVLYNAARPSTALPGLLAQRSLAGAVALADWLQRAPMQQALLDGLRDRPLLALAGIAAPQRFFAMLQERGLQFDTLPLPDHARLDPLPWPAGTPDVVCTEKDAAKVDPARCGATRVWVVGLDFRLPAELIAALRSRIAPPRPP